VLSRVPLIESSTRRDPTAAGRVVLELDFLGNLNERGDGLTVELGNLGDDALEAFPEITPGEGEIDDGVPEGHGGENITECDISSVDRGAESTSVGDSGVGVCSTIPLNGVRDDVTEVAFASLAGAFVEKDVGPSDDLFGELDEGKSPLADLSLELRVDGGGIGHVDRGTGVLDDAALVVEANVESAELFTPPVCGDDEDLLAFQVLLDRGVGT
jgi:hypothetical protein